MSSFLDLSHLTLDQYRVEDGEERVQNNARKDQPHQTPAKVVGPAREYVVAESERGIVDRCEDDQCLEMRKETR